MAICREASMAAIREFIKKKAGGKKRGKEKDYARFKTSTKYFKEAIKAWMAHLD